VIETLITGNKLDMPPIRSQTGNILVYNAQHRVLICRDCQYAVQKSALASHLLRHKIYRTDRQQLLSSVSSLDVLEPEDVLLPGPTSSPVDELPVIDELRCTVAGCEYLYASEKRMKKHRSESHFGVAFQDLKTC
jgi:hypothetical protein